MNYIDIELVLGFSSPGKSVDLFDSNGHIYRGTSSKAGAVNLKHRMLWPNRLRMVIHETQQSDADCAVRLERLVLGRMPINTAVLPKICLYDKQDGQAIDHTNVWNSSGTVTIEFPQEDIIKYLMSINNKFQFT